MLDTVRCKENQDAQFPFTFEMVPDREIRPIPRDGDNAVNDGETDEEDANVLIGRLEETVHSKMCTRRFKLQHL